MHLDRQSYPEVEGLMVEFRAMPETTHACPHCGCAVRYPLVVREADASLLTQMIQTAKEWMSESGYTQHLIAKLRAKCEITRIRDL